jgi:DNA invertase Pin-like site-specific DNA recombinase
MKTQAIALCRVSTQKQRTEGTSLEAQEKSVYECADALGATIVKTWSLDTSSKKGRNLARKDLREIMAYCKAHRAVKYSS